MHDRAGKRSSLPRQDSRRAAIANARRQWRKWEAEEKDGPRLRVGVAATYTVEPLVPLLGSHLVEAGVSPELLVAPYNQLFQLCLDHAAYFSGVDVIVLLWRLEDVVPKELERFIADDRSALEDAKDVLGELIRALHQLRGTFSGTIVVSVPAFPQGIVTALLDLDAYSHIGVFYREICLEWHRLLQDAGGFSVIDMDALQRYLGAEASFDARKWYLYKQPYADSFLYVVGHSLARIISSERQASRKCVVVDCDNTLWGGIVGEAGLSGIDIGTDFPGSAFRDFQRLLQYWRSRGVLVAIASKNNEADVWEVFDRHDGMLLRRDDVSAWRIDWNSKAHNIQLIADDLNISTDSMVFIDDNPVEIEMMRALRPEVLSIIVSEDPALMVEEIKAYHPFDRVTLTIEDRQRADMMRVERQRAQLGSSLSADEFLADLKIETSVFLARPEHIGRIAQLINKTNQFNLTTIRRSLNEVMALSLSEGWQIFGLRVCDRFGDYGLVGVGIVNSQEFDVVRLDTFLLSCRVLGRGVETAFLAGIAEYLQGRGVREIRAAFIPSAKNAPAASFLPQHRFIAGGGGEYLADIHCLPGAPTHIHLSARD